MAEGLIVVRSSSPNTQWYKVFASGSEDPDIYAGYISQQANKYCIDGLEIVQTFKCRDSASARIVFERMAAFEMTGRVDVHKMRRWEMGRWSNLPLSTLRRLITEAINGTDKK